MYQAISVVSSTGKPYVLDSVSTVCIGLRELSTGRKYRVWFTRSLDIFPAEQQCFCTHPDLGQVFQEDVDYLAISQFRLAAYFKLFWPYGIIKADLTPDELKALTEGTITLHEPVLNEARQLLIRDGKPTAIRTADGSYYLLNDLHAEFSV